MLRFVSETARTYKRMPINKLVILIFLVAGMLYVSSFSFISIKILGVIIRIGCIGLFVGCLFYFSHKLLEKLVNRPVYGNPKFQDEYIEFHDDHIRVCQFDSVVGKSKYDDVTIYYEDIDYSRIKDLTFGIQLKSKISNKTKMILADQYDSGYFEVFLVRFPENVQGLLVGLYKNKVNLVSNT